MNLYETAQIVEAGAAHKLIQAAPGKDHVFIFECSTCTQKAWVADNQ